VSRSEVDRGNGRYEGMSGKRWKGGSGQRSMVGAVIPEVEGRVIVSMEGCNRLVHLESSSIEVKRPALFQRASSAALMSALTSASISACLMEEEELKMNIYPRTVMVLEQEDISLYLKF
jgi:hypothetical protein